MCAWFREQVTVLCTWSFLVFVALPNHSFHVLIELVLFCTLEACKAQAAVDHDMLCGSLCFLKWENLVEPISDTSSAAGCSHQINQSIDLSIFLLLNRDFCGSGKLRSHRTFSIFPRFDLYMIIDNVVYITKDYSFGKGAMSAFIQHRCYKSFQIDVHHHITMELTTDKSRISERIFKHDLGIVLLKRSQ